MTERISSVREAYVLALTGWPMLALYALAQASLSFVVSVERPELKLVLEPYVLFFGLILHAQWRRVRSVFELLGLRRPRWIAVADCASFIITFWALSVLAQAFF